MSNDGEITVEVSAEGTEDAAGDLAGGGGEGGGQGLAGSIRGGAIGGLIATGFRSLLDTLSPILDVLNAFLAPLALLAFRLLGPVLRELLPLLPAVFDFINAVAPAFTFIGELIATGIAFLKSGFDRIVNNLSGGSLLDKISTGIATLIGGIAGAKVGALVGGIIGGFLGSVVPGLGTAIGTTIGTYVGGLVGGIVGGITGGVTLNGVVRRIVQLPGKIASLLPGGQAVETATNSVSSAGQTIVNIAGGVPAFIDEVTRSRRTDG